MTVTLFNTSMSRLLPLLLWILVHPMASISLSFMQKCAAVGVFNAHYTLGECMINQRNLFARQQANILVFSIACVAFGKEWLPAAVFVNCFVSCFDVCSPFHPEPETADSQV